jgi:hypothetical protein
MKKIPLFESFGDEELKFLASLGITDAYYCKNGRASLKLVANPRDIAANISSVSHLNMTIPEVWEDVYVATGEQVLDNLQRKEFRKLLKSKFGENFLNSAYDYVCDSDPTSKYKRRHTLNHYTTYEAQFEEALRSGLITLNNPKTDIEADISVVHVDKFYYNGVLAGSLGVLDAKFNVIDDCWPHNRFPDDEDIKDFNLRVKNIIG